jgi:hypothetical protein
MGKITLIPPRYSLYRFKKKKHYVPKIIKIIDMKKYGLLEAYVITLEEVMKKLNTFILYYSS